MNLLLVLWLLPCALQDYRTRRISNWLTLPAFVLAWPVALWLGGSDRLLLTFAVFVGGWAAWQMHTMGAADGKIAVALAAVSPLALVLGVAVLTGMFAGLWVWKRQWGCIWGRWARYFTMSADPGRFHQIHQAPG